MNKRGSRKGHFFISVEGTYIQNPEIYIHFVLKGAFPVELSHLAIMQQDPHAYSGPSVSFLPNDIIWHEPVALPQP